jgi:hypothetical protein
MKLPLAFSLKNRDSTTDKDARVLNGYVEVRKNRKGKVESLRTYKRPALDSAFELSAGTGQALYVPTSADGTNDVPGVVIGDILTRSPTPVTKRLSFSVQPSQSNLNTAISPSVVVQALNSIGGVVSGFTSVVTMSLGTNPTSATLGGTVTTAAVSGVATFSNLQLNRSGDDFTLRAVAANINSATSTNFDIPTTLSFTVQPSSAGPGETMDPVEVTAQDLSGNTDTNYSGNITIAIYTASAAGVLSGTLTVAATNGVASFTNLEIDTAGNYTFVATAESDSDSYTPALRVSDTFVIGEGYSITAGEETVGGIFMLRGFNTAGFLGFGAVGSISPTTFDSGNIIRFATTYTAGVPTATVFIVSGNHAQGSFTSFTTPVLGTLNSADANYGYDSGTDRTTWQWLSTDYFTATGSYTTTFS